jgi:HK97 family phage prohead protease
VYENKLLTREQLGSLDPIEHKAATLTAPMVDVERRLVSGYASTWGTLDTAGDVMLPGCFDGTLRELETTGKALPLLVGHDKHLHIGESVELTDDGVGLYAVWRLFPDTEAPSNTARLKMLARNLAEDRPDAFSVGFLVKQSEQKATTRMVKSASLHEVSLVLGGQPANDLARIGPPRERRDIAGELADLEAFVADQTYGKTARDRFDAEWARRDAMLKSLPGLIDDLGATIATARSDPDERRAEMEQLDRFVTAQTEANDRDALKTVDAAEGRRLWDASFRRSFDAAHPPRTCACRGHQLFRREV